MLKGEYTNLKINHDNLVISHEFLSNEPHDATNDVVKIDIATSCDDFIVESIEQGSSGKGKQVVETDNYDEYVKLKHDNEKLKKDLEELKTTNTIVLETLENEKLKKENKKLKEEKNNDALKEENKKLKLEKEHLKIGLSKFTRGKHL